MLQFLQSFHKGQQTHDVIHGICSRLKDITMKTLICLALTISLVLPSIALAVEDIADLERRLLQQERRIDRLEREVEILQDKLMDSEYGTTGTDRARDINTIDPLVGNWECSNNVFTYDISFYDNGLLVQEEPFFSSAKSSKWSRLNENNIATDRGLTFSTSFQSEDRVTVTNRSNQEVWECSRKR